MRDPFATRLLALAALLAVTACGGPPSRTLERAGVSVTFDDDGALLLHRDGRLILRGEVEGPTTTADPNRDGAAYAGFAVAHTTWREVHELYGFFDFEEEIGAWRRLEPVDVAVEGERLVFAFPGGGMGEVTLGEDASVRVTWTAPPGSGDRMAMSFACEADERFFGLGAQVSAEHRGYRVPIWTTEQGVGKADRGERPAVFGLIGYHYDSYAPIPFAVSSRPLGLWLDDPYRSEFELCEAGGALRIEATGPRFDLHLFPADSMADALEAFTARTGRADPVSRWTFAPWIDTFGGPDATAEALALLRAHEIPASALWSEDWVGIIPALGGENLSYDWAEDPELYPDLAATARAIHAEGLRYLTYFNPFLPEITAVYGELEAAGALVVDEDGEVIPISFPFGAIPAYFDPTSAEGLSILADYQARAADKGVDGWMADYGEGLPFEAVLADGRSGAEAHNDYPLMWARANKSFWEARRPDGDFAIFSRSGFTGMAAATHVHWLGDQIPSFDRNDGLGSVIPLYLSAGLSGLSLTHSDVGGYSVVPAAPRTFEVWARWLAFEAFTPILRTHHTSAPDGAVQWWSDETTLALFGRYARWHQRLLPYFAMVAGEAHDRGHPAVRPIWWGAEDRADLFDVEDAALVGPDLLLAPILEAGATSRTVRLPPGQWRRWPDLFAPLGEGRAGEVTVEAAIEDPILFVRAGAAVALLDQDWRTLAPARPDRLVDPEVSVAPDEIDGLRLMLVAGGEGQGRIAGYTFPDAEWTWDGQAAAGGPITAIEGGGASLEACPADPGATDCIADGVARLGAAWLDGRTITLRTGGGEGTLTFRGRMRRLEIEVR
jgi:sulfoquinovosidase